MPERLILVPARKWIAWVNHHQNVVVTGLAFLLVVALVVAVAGWTQARNAEQRVTKVEIQAAADRAAADQGKKISQVVTCFNAANGRPLLTTILRALASREFDPSVRAAFDSLISQYEDSSTPGIVGPPTIDKCRALAVRLGVNPDQYDPTG